MTAQKKPYDQRVTDLEGRYEALRELINDVRTDTCGFLERRIDQLDYKVERAVQQTNTLQKSVDGGIRRLQHWQTVSEDIKNLETELQEALHIYTMESQEAQRRQRNFYAALNMIDSRQDKRYTTMQRFTIALAAFVLVLAAHAVFGQTIEWNGKTDNRFSYTVCSGTAPAISHWELCTPELPLDASEPFEWSPDREYQLKFDGGYAEGECREVTIDLGRRVGRSQYAIKSGQDWVYGTIAGPACELAIYQYTPPETPDRFDIGKPYPSPFNRSVFFRIAVPRHTKLRLDVTDILGNFRRTIYYDIGKGAETLRIDGPWRTSGVYWFRFDTGSSVYYRAATLIR